MQWVDMLVHAQNFKISYRCNINYKVSEKFVLAPGVWLKLGMIGTDNQTNERIYGIKIDYCYPKLVSKICTISDIIENYESNDLDNWLEYLKLKYGV